MILFPKRFSGRLRDEAPSRHAYFPLVHHGDQRLPKHFPEAPFPWLATQRERHGFISLPVEERSFAHLSQLPRHHDDPFDRLLISQAIGGDLLLVTVDPVLAKYSASLLPSSQ